jgi:hypothetical protein
LGQALYRKYRSKKLSEVIGQEHITKTLQNALKSGQISHAYLLTGPKGTGINWIPDDTKGLRITTRPSAIIGATLGTILGAMASRRASRLTGAVIGFFAGAVAVSATGWAKSEGF